MGSLINTLVRRWPLALAALLLAVGAGYGMAARTGPTYSFTASTLLLPPQAARHVDPNATDYTAGNPLFYLGNLSQARDILIGAMTSQDVQDQVVKRFPGASYTVGGDVLQSAPVVVIGTESSSRADARALLAHLTASLPDLLTQVQTGIQVTPDGLITSYQLLTDADPAISRKGQIRAAVVGFGGGLVPLILLIGAVDALLRIRRTRQEEQAAGPVRVVPDPDGESGWSWFRIREGTR